MNADPQGRLGGETDDLGPQFVSEGAVLVGALRLVTADRAGRCLRLGSGVVDEQCDLDAVVEFQLA
ncbi:hypothetical protein, partial [Streptomyces niveus]